MCAANVPVVQSTLCSACSSVREGPPRQAGVQAVLREPGRELAVPVEPETEERVAHDVMYGTEAVVRSTHRDIEERVVTIAVEVRGTQLEQSV